MGSKKIGSYFMRITLSGFASDVLRLMFTCPGQREICQRALTASSKELGRPVFCHYVLHIETTKPNYIIPTFT